MVWFKRDLRVTEHLPFTEAALGGPVLPVYIVEPIYWHLPDTSARQWAFTAECLRDLQDTLRELGLPLIIRTGDVVSILADVHARFGVKALFSHEETGNTWTFERDKRVARWLKKITSDGPSTLNLAWFEG